MKVLPYINALKNRENEKYQFSNDDKILFKNKLDNTKLKISLKFKSNNNSMMKTSANSVNINRSLNLHKMNDKSNYINEITTFIKEKDKERPNIYSYKNLKVTQPNQNGILAKFRQEMEYKKEIIDIELEKSMDLRFKHSNIYKRLKREEQAEKEKNKKLAEEKLRTRNRHNENSDKEFLKLNNYYRQTRSISRTNIINNRSNIFQTDLNNHEHKHNVALKHTTNLSSQISYSFSPRRNSINFISNSKKLTKKKSPKSFIYKSISDIKEIDPDLNKKMKTSKNQNELTSSKDKDDIFIPNRKKTYKVKYIPNWHEKTGFPPQQFHSNMLNSVEYQSSIIVDEMKVLLDKLHYFNIHFLQGTNLLIIFKNIDNDSQIRLNKVLEETCGLLIELPKIMLLDFSQYINKLLVNQPPNELFKTIEVDNEEVTFLSNCNLLVDVNLFIKSSFDVYLLIVKQVEDMLLSNKKFEKLTQFLSRARYNISNLITTFKNSSMNIKIDQQHFQRFKQLSKKNHEQEYDEACSITKILKKKPALPKIKNKKHESKRVNIVNKIRRQINNENEEHLKISRLNNLLDRTGEAEDYLNITKNDAKKIQYKSALNSDIMTKLLKYCPKQFKDQVISQRIVENYGGNNDNDD